MALKNEGDTKGGALSDPALLDKIDELRRLGVASMVPLPQVGVILQYEYSLWSCTQHMLLCLRLSSLGSSLLGNPVSSKA